MNSLCNEADFRAMKQQSPYPRGVIVHWGAAWCSPCADLNVYLAEQCAAGFAASKEVGFLYIDVEKFPDITEAEGVDSVPHVGFYRTGESSVLSLVAEVSGAKIPAIQLNLRSLYGHDAREKHTTLDSYLKHLIDRDNIVAFITGTPSRPMCGFTGRLMQLFDELAVPFTYIDIMESGEVCEGLKSFSSWPTYPQVYVEGELVGGLDICLELHKNNQLKTTLKME